jgi:hypothetical protein
MNENFEEGITLRFIITHVIKRKLGTWIPIVSKNSTAVL